MADNQGGSGERFERVVRYCLVMTWKQVNDPGKEVRVCIVG